MLLPSITFLLGIVSLASCMMHGESSRNSRKERGNILEAEAVQVKKRALVITTNRDSMYFKMNSAFAYVLSDIFNEHFLILNTTNENAGKIKEGLDKAFIQYDEKIPIKDSLPNTYRIVKISGKFDENSALSIITKQISSKGIQKELQNC
uniref:Glucuronosyltransferase n=1 Tax=Meloidogyne floridensis TaxID=298350 RepID=A0A915P956_9BILA